MPSHHIQAGQLRQTLYLQESTDSYGNPGTWANVSSNPTVRCAIRTASGSEPVSAAGERGQRTLEITLRYRSDIGYKNRLSDGASPARIFDIQHIDNVNDMDHKLLLTVVERTSG